MFLRDCKLYRFLTCHLHLVFLILKVCFCVVFTECNIVIICVWTSKEEKKTEKGYFLYNLLIIHFQKHIYFHPITACWLFFKIMTKNISFLARFCREFYLEICQTLRSCSESVALAPLVVEAHSNVPGRHRYCG